jgi:hypothetical protein
MARNTVRVNIPTNPTEQITLLGTVSAKNTDLGAASPLGSLKWDKISPALADAKTHDDTAGALAKQVEKEYRARDISMPAVTQALRDARDLLLVANRDNPKALGDFGFEVDDTPQTKPVVPPPATPPP